MLSNPVYNPQPRYPASMPVLPSSHGFQSINGQFPTPLFVAPSLANMAPKPASIQLPGTNASMLPQRISGNSFNPVYPTPSFVSQNNPAGVPSNPAGTPGVPLNGTTLLIGAASIVGLVLAGMGIHHYFKKDAKQPKNDEKQPNQDQTDGSGAKPGSTQPGQEGMVIPRVDVPAEDELEPVENKTESDEQEITHQNNDTTAPKKSPLLKRLKQLPPDKDFSKKYKELDHIDFSNLDLTNASFKGMIVTECKFDDAKLDGANFENAEFDNCSFRDTEDGRFLYPKNVNARNSRFYMGSIGLDGGERKGMKSVPGLRRKETPEDFFDRSSWYD